MKLVCKIKGRIRAKIEQVEAVGFYLFIFDPESGRCTHDYLQDTLEIALEQGEEDFALSKDKWRPTS
jgi:hypothetical protein